eukprot:scaffold164_cov340-Pinguiococcus_pyrenoidosus.AAC.6
MPTTCSGARCEGVPSATGANLISLGLGTFGASPSQSERGGTASPAFSIPIGLVRFVSGKVSGKRPGGRARRRSRGTRMSS